MSVTKNSNANVQKTKKKGGIIALFLLAIVAVFGLYMAIIKSKDESFDLTLLENLMDLDYEVVSAEEDEDLEKFEIVIKTDEKQEALYELAEEFKSIVEDEVEKTVDLGVHVYSIAKQEETLKTETSESEKDKEEITVESSKNDVSEDEDYRQYIEVTEKMTVTNAVEIGDLIGEAGITADWELHTPVEKGKYKTVMFNFGEKAAEEELDNETIFKQLKGIYSVMEKHNDTWTEDVIAAVINESEDSMHTYTAKYPTKLFITEEIEVVKTIEK